jgi:hypothetical protein
MFIIDVFKSRRRLEAENLFLRHQLSIALRRTPPCLRLDGSDRALLVWMTESSRRGSAVAGSEAIPIRERHGGWRKAACARRRGGVGGSVR